MATAIPKNSTVLVTGINGFIASHVADQLLLAGFNVRGTARTLSKGSSAKIALEARHPDANISLVVVPDMAQAGAFDEAIKGVSGIIHVASNISFDANPNNVIPEVVAGIKGILESAAAEPSVKRFVYTSSSVAAACTRPNHRFVVDSSTWNEFAIEAAHKPPPYDGRGYIVYSASKAEGEKAFWEFVKEKKPGFVANAVLPNCNFGEIFVEGQVGSTGSFLRTIYEDDGKHGENVGWKNMDPQWFVDVVDDARLHVAALLFPDVENERIFAFAEPFNWDDVFKIIEEVDPGHKLPENPQSPNDRDLSEIAEKPRAEELLRRMGQDGFRSLKDTVREVIKGF
jgi:nucleoside-diphosphate-sugar epimerase